MEYYKCGGHKLSVEVWYFIVVTHALTKLFTCLCNIGLTKKTSAQKSCNIKSVAVVFVVKYQSKLVQNRHYFCVKSKIIFQTIALKLRPASYIFTLLFTALIVKLTNIIITASKAQHRCYE